MIEASPTLVVVDLTSVHTINPARAMYCMKQYTYCNPECANNAWNSSDVWTGWQSQRNALTGKEAEKVSNVQKTIVKSNKWDQEERAKQWYWCDNPQTQLYQASANNAVP